MLIMHSLFDPIGVFSSGTPISDTFLCENVKRDLSGEGSASRGGSQFQELDVEISSLLQTVASEVLAVRRTAGKEGPRHCEEVESEHSEKGGHTVHALRHPEGGSAEKTYHLV